MKELTYKLCKQLKEAGFPQKILLGSRYYDESMEISKLLKGFINSVPMGDKLIEGWLKIPTLEELIDECGDEFYSLTYVKGKAPEAYPPSKRIQEIREGNLWVADGEHAWTTVKTKKEAVAKLYIKLKNL